MPAGMLPWRGIENVLPGLQLLRYDRDRLPERQHCAGLGTECAAVDVESVLYPVLYDENEECHV